MLVKIWSSVSLIVNEKFVGLSDQSNSSFVTSFSEEMFRITKGKQHWLANLVSEEEYSSSLIERSAGRLNGETAGSLVFYTEGFAPAFNTGSLSLQEAKLKYLLRLCEVFNKRIIYMSLPVFAEATSEQKTKIINYNKLLKSIVRPFDQELDVKDLSLVGEAVNKRVSNPEVLGTQLARSVILSHAEGRDWIERYAQV